MEITYKSFSRGVAENCGTSHKRILPNKKKEQILTMCNNFKGSGGHEDEQENQLKKLRAL